MLTLLVNFIRARVAEYRDRQALRQLLEHDDRMLSDIGLTRGDVESALSKPFGLGARTEAFRLSRLSRELDRLC